MTASNGTAELQTGIEDVLAHLPVSSTIDYRKRETIYGPGVASKGIYLVISGKVGISQITEDHTEVLLDIVRPDELFGESAFLAEPRCSERTTAIEPSKVMTWPVAEIEKTSSRNGRAWRWRYFRFWRSATSS